MTWRQDHLLEEDVGVELWHGVAGVKDQVSAGVDSPDGLERLSRVAEVCHQDVAVSSAVEPLQLDNVLLEKMTRARDQNFALSGSLEFLFRVLLL